MNNKVGILTWDGYQDQEVIYPYYRISEEENLNVVLFSNPVGSFATGLFGTKINRDCDVTQLSEDNSFWLEKLSMIILPGGVKALEKLRQEKQVLNFINKFQKTGKVISSTCHGAQLLISAKVVAGRKISGYYSIKDDIENAGATYVDAPYVIDGNIISSPHYKHMGSWMRETIKLFRTIETLKNSD